MSSSKMIYRELFSELPYGAVLSEENLPRRCSNCFAIGGVKVPCKSGDGDDIIDGCGRLFYCTEECRDNDRPNHSYECVVFKKRGQIDEYVRLLARLITRRSIDNGVADLSRLFPPNVPDRSFDDLMSHEKEFDESPYRHCGLDRHLEEFRDAYSSTPLTDDMALAKRIYCIMVTNCFSVSGDSNVTCGLESYLGLALYLNVSRFNHACQPDLHVSFDNARLLVHFPSTEREEDAARQWSRMTENADVFNRLTISYGFSSQFIGNSQFPLREQRRSWLSFAYHFECECVMCSDDRVAALETDAAAIECASCSEPYVWSKREDDPNEPRFWLCCIPRSKSSDFAMNCRKSCACESNRNETKMVKKYVKMCSRKSSISYDQLVEKWHSATSTSLKELYAEDVITTCEPLWNVARLFWHRTANLRLSHVNERLFVSSRELVVSSFGNSQKPIDQHLLRLAIATGELTLSWYARNRIRIAQNLAAIAYAFKLARLYEIAAISIEVSPKDEDGAICVVQARMSDRAAYWYEFAASGWAAYGKSTVKFVDELTENAQRMKMLAENLRKMNSPM